MDGDGDGDGDGETGGDGAEEKAKRWAHEEGAKEYPIMTERAEAIARWIREAPLPGEAGSVRNRAAAAKKAAGRLPKTAPDVGGLDGLEKSVENLSVGGSGGAGGEE